MLWDIIMLEWLPTTYLANLAQPRQTKELECENSWFIFQFNHYYFEYSPVRNCDESKVCYVKKFLKRMGTFLEQ